MSRGNTVRRIPIRDLVLYYLRLGAIGFGPQSMMRTSSRSAPWLGNVELGAEFTIPIVQYVFKATLPSSRAQKGTLGRDR